MKYQVTIYCASGKYKPISTIVEAKEEKDLTKIKYLGIEKICLKKLWTSTELKKYEYTKIKMRKWVDK